MCVFMRSTEAETERNVFFQHVIKNVNKVDSQRQNESAIKNEGLKGGGLEINEINKHCRIDRQLILICFIQKVTCKKKKTASICNSWK